MEKERTDWNRWLVIAALLVILSLAILHRAPLTWLTRSLIEVGTHGAGALKIAVTATST